jgi:ABC-type transporter Mla subunit MlaD
MYTKNAELKAGILVVVAIGALLGFLYKAAGSKLPWAEGPKIHLRFEQGFAAPTRGDPVTMNGLRVGTVASVAQATEPRGTPGPDGKTIPLTDRDRARLKLRPGEAGVAREIFVTAVVELAFADQVIPKGTRGQITVNLTGARSLALLPGLSTENIVPEETEHDPILTTAAGDIADIQRSIDELARKIGSVADNANLVLSDVREAIAAIRKKLDVIDLAGIQSNILDGSKDVREMLSSAKQRVDEITAKISDAATNVKGLSADAAKGVKDLVADLKDMLGHLKSASAEIDAVVARNAPKIDAMFDDVRKAAHSAASAVKEFEGLGSKVQTILGTVGGDLDRILARVAEGAHNLSDVLEDLRANPWKLANKPDDKEIAFENLRNAASNYVRAQQSMSESLTKLKELSARADLSSDDRRALIDRAMKLLAGDLAKYEATARIFADMLQSRGVKAPR